MRTRVYVDGFNLCYGDIKGTHNKLLDLVTLRKLLHPQECVVEKVRYFTAHVSGAADPDAPKRQGTYLKELRALPEIEFNSANSLARQSGTRSLICQSRTDRPLPSLLLRCEQAPTKSRIRINDSGVPAAGTEVRQVLTQIRPRNLANRPLAARPNCQVPEKNFGRLRKRAPFQHVEKAIFQYEKLLEDCKAACRGESFRVLVAPLGEAGVAQG